MLDEGIHDDCAGVSIDLSLFGGMPREALVGIVACVRECGFVGVEFGVGALAANERHDLVSLCRESELSVAAVHCSIGMIIDDGCMDQVLETARQVDARWLGVVGVVGGSSTKLSFQQTGLALAKAAELGASEGIRVAYHHQDFDLTTRFGDGKTGLDLIVDEGETAVYLAIDTFWAAVAGVRVNQLWNDHRPQVVALYLVDGDPHTRRFCALGSGRVHLSDSLGLARAEAANGTFEARIAYSQPLPDDGPAARCVRLSSEWIRQNTRGWPT